METLTIRAIIWEAWRHERGYVCFITELGAPIRKGESFGAFRLGK